MSDRTRSPILNPVQSYELINILKAKTVMIEGAQGTEGAICRYADPDMDDNLLGAEMDFPCTGKQVERIRQMAIGKIKRSPARGRVYDRLNDLEQRVRQLEEQATKPPRSVLSLNRSG